LREVDKQHRLTRRLASVLHDHRNPEQVRLRRDTMVRQRVFGVAAGYGDLNDHEALRFDQMLQTAVGGITTYLCSSLRCSEKSGLTRQRKKKQN
ncbi:MAG: transposase, partial [Halomonas sp.]|uniref:transposase n=1 Tax=Halomonas sp. TaxID=1486246 RepID=UPI003F90E302